MPAAANSAIADFMDALVVADDAVDDPFEPSGDSEPKEPEPVKPPEPSSVSLEDFNKLQDRIASLEASAADAPILHKIEDLKIEEQNFLPDGSFTELLGSPEKLNAMLNAVYAKALEDALRILPPTILKLTTSQVTQQTAVADFFTRNPELKPHRKLIGYMTNDVVAAMPNATLAEVLAEVEKQAKASLNVSTRATNAALPTAPRMKSGGTNSDPAPEPGQKQQIKDFLTAIKA